MTHKYHLAINFWWFPFASLIWHNYMIANTWAWWNSRWCFSGIWWLFLLGPPRKWNYSVRSNIAQAFCFSIEPWLISNDVMYLCKINKIIVTLCSIYLEYIFFMVIFIFSWFFHSFVCYCYNLSYESDLVDCVFLCLCQMLLQSLHPISFYVSPNANLQIANELKRHGQY